MKNLPAQLINSLKSLSGFDPEAFIEAHHATNKITSIRFNPFKAAEPDFQVNEAVKWCSGSFYLNERPYFTYDPLFHAGCYYVQEAGSMFLEHALKSVLDFSKPLHLLDLCAAPGGKSTLINSLMSNESLLVANETVKQRALTLAHNLGKWGTNNTIVTNNDPQKFSGIPPVFDAMVVDAPCSGSGLFRKQPEAIDEWSPESVILCSARQKRILADALPSLKEGGFLVYSTCSYSVEENEMVVEWLINERDMEYVPLSLQKDWGIIESDRGYRFYPHLTKSEGFFCAVLRKKGSSYPHAKMLKHKDFLLKTDEKSIISDFIRENGCFFKNNGQIHFMNEPSFAFLSCFDKHFYFKKAGLTLGEIKGRDLVPNQELAWYIGLKAQSRVDLNKENSLLYLKKLRFDAPLTNTGLALISYKEKGIGWVKILQNRTNNYLPNELRILN